jgi:hypothetical protein
VPNLFGADDDASWDAQFAAMETDEGYRSLQLAIVEEFASSDREAWWLC